MEIAQLQTPCLLIDQDKLKFNIKRLLDYLNKQNVVLRLHGKTCKNIQIARMCMESNTGPITVATLEEAEYFAANGLADIIYAVGIAPQKLERALKIRQKGVKLQIVIDNPQTAANILEFAAASGHAFDIILEIDCDGHRSGFAPENAAEILQTANMLINGGQAVCGVLTHAGSAYELADPSPATFAALSKKENQSALKVANLLRENGIDCDIVSVGSTPTAIFGNDFQGITEVRAGVFPFMDLVMTALGVCDATEIALSTLCAVIGQRAKDRAIIVDAGWSALSSDRGLASRFADYGYGLVCDLNGNIIDGLKVAELNQEHGILISKSGQTPALAPGSLLRILPIHACATASNFGGYYLLHNNKIIDKWHRCPSRQFV